MAMIKWSAREGRDELGAYWELRRKGAKGHDIGPDCRFNEEDAKLILAALRLGEANHAGYIASCQYDEGQISKLAYEQRRDEAVAALATYNVAREALEPTPDGTIEERAFLAARDEALGKEANQ